MATSQRRRPQRDNNLISLNGHGCLSNSESDYSRKTRTRRIRKRPKNGLLIAVVVILGFFIIYVLCTVWAYLFLSQPRGNDWRGASPKTLGLDRPLNRGARHRMEVLSLRGNHALLQAQDTAFEAWKKTSHEMYLSVEERQIHFIFGLWDNDGDPSKPADQNMPLFFRRNLQVYQAQNPGWRIRTWFNRTEINSLVERWTSPQPQSESSLGMDDRQTIRQAWAVARPVQKADLFRYLLLHQFGGFYFDLDVVTSGNNTVEFFMKQVELDPRLHTAALFWEMGRLTPEEQAISAKEIVRRGLPEYKTRLSNYCLWSKPQSNLTKCAIQLASSRILYVQQHFNVTTIQQKIPATLYSSGPDVVTECAFGVRRSDEMHGTAAEATSNMDSEDEVLTRHMTKDRVLVVDPGPNLINGNTFSWRNAAAA
eukprot:scaffold10700_cov108-Cylindrotheca_fusiformis.AAC.5